MQTTAAQEYDSSQQTRLAHKAGQAMNDGKLVVFPTETVYGIGVAAASDAGYRALIDLKTRPPGSPFAIHLPDPQAAGHYVDMSSPLLSRLIRKAFPGPVTLVLDVTEETIGRKIKALGLGPEIRDRIYHNHTVGLRCPDHPLASVALNAVHGPVVASSANLRGDPPPHDAQTAQRSIGKHAAITLDGGMSQFTKPSTVVRVKQDPTGLTDFTVLREGVYDKRMIQRMLRWTMLVVCSGNTCRSPMAQMLALQLLAEQRGVAMKDLEAAGIAVISAGTSAGAGLEATEQAQITMNRLDLDLSSHQSQPLTAQMVHEADVIYCMTESHLQNVLRLEPAAASKVHMLDESGDIDDPFGADVTVYARCAEVIRRRLSQRIKEQQV